MSESRSKDEWAGWNFGPFFFDESQNMTSCTVDADPDIAGIGVVVAFIAGSFVTTVASVCAALLDGILENGENIWPLFVTAWLSRLTHRGRYKQYYKSWRRVIEKLILGFADQQLVTGFALLVAAWLKLYLRNQGFLCYQNSHFYLVLYLACLSSGTHLASILVLVRYFKKHPVTAKIRIAFIILFALFLTGSLIWIIVIPTTSLSKLARHWPAYGIILFLCAICLFILYIYWITIMRVIAPEDSHLRETIFKILTYPLRIPSRVWRRFRASRHKEYHRSYAAGEMDKRISMLRRLGYFLIFANGGLVFLIQIVCSLLSLAFVLVEKFAQPWGNIREDYDVKSLSNAEENSFGFGQIVALILLTLPVLAALEAYYEEKVNRKKRSRSSKSSGASELQMT